MLAIRLLIIGDWNLRRFAKDVDKLDTTSNPNSFGAHTWYKYYILYKEHYNYSIIFIIYKVYNVFRDIYDV